ncbi:Hexaprenyldihydroxybenzoate methyltransferase, mitochondrial, partial [Trachymyrmex cornetzi]
KFQMIFKKLKQSEQLQIKFRNFCNLFSEKYVSPIVDVECLKIVKPGKSIFLTTVNRTLTSLMSTIIASEYIFGSIPYGTHTWNKFITPHEVQCILKDYGCEIRSIRGTKYNPVTNKWSWSSSVSTFYLLHAIKQKETGV